MFRHVPVVACVLQALLAPASLRAEPEFMLVPLPAGAVGGSVVADLSSDGNVVVCQTLFSNAGTRSYAWRRGQGLVVLGLPEGWVASTNLPATALAGNGSAVFGSGHPQGRMIRWDVSSGAATVLPLAPYPDDTSHSYTPVSATETGDGVVVRVRGVRSLNAPTRTYRWAGGYSEIPSPGGSGTFIGVDASANGNRVVGTIFSGPAVWSAGQGTALLPPPTGGASSDVAAISDDGLVIAGLSTLGPTLWVDGQPRLVHPATPQSTFFARMSGNGKVIAGNGGGQEPSAWLYWSHGPRMELRAYLSSMGLDTSGVSSLGSADRLRFSADGRVIAGTGLTNVAWIARGLEFPCNTADFDYDGDLGTDADIEAFFACLGGNCCVTCGTADFNGDGDIGTDADIESFFRVLAGGSC